MNKKEKALIEALEKKTNVTSARIKMPSKPYTLFFAKTLEGKLLNAGNSMTRREYIKWLQRCIQTNSGDTQEVSNDG